MKSRRFRSLGVAVPEAYGGLGMGFVSTMLVCDISGATGSFSTVWSTYGNRYYADNFIWY
jgi:alkylation response protein AidB-like acyl-CoA dehydrogenase